jgi:hypothetical protein
MAVALMARQTKRVGEDDIWQRARGVTQQLVDGEQWRMALTCEHSAGNGPQWMRRGGMRRL